MSFVHESVGRACGEYLKSELRQIYTTPKSYLELIALYKKLLAEQTSKIEAQQERLMHMRRQQQRVEQVGGR